LHSETPVGHRLTKQTTATAAAAAAAVAVAVAAPLQLEPSAAVASSPLTKAEKQQQQQQLPVLQQAVLQEAGKYGQMVQAVYDTLLTKDIYSLYFGNCVPGVMIEGQKLSCPKVQTYTQLGEEAQKYTVSCRCQQVHGLQQAPLRCCCSSYLAESMARSTQLWRVSRADIETVLHAEVRIYDGRHSM
jgi:hypothetical protein